MISRVRLPGVHHSAPARSGPPRDPAPKPAPPKTPMWRNWLLPLGLLITALLLFAPSMSGGPASLEYSELLARVNAGAVASVSVNDKGAVDGRLKDGTEFTSQIPTALDTSELASRLAAKNVRVKGTQTGGSFLGILLSFLPLLLLVAFFLWTGRQARRQLAGGLGGIGRSRAKVTDTERPETRFADVAGYEGAKQEISEVVDFLRNPERYRRAGAKGPRGVLMVGPPGTGKTLLARAVAGEAEVPFLSVTGSGFVEMFVGVGASRVRDLFAEARKRAPSIIFIDEIDSIGGRRGGGAFGGANDEREQTLNQLLAEMDGFDSASGVVVLAATNRPETLDPALLRAGRFDRQVTVPLPTQSERAAILAVHGRGKTLGDDVDWDVVARGTPGFSGADLANLVNEAAIHAVRAGRDVVTAEDLGAARDRILLGRREASNALLPDEKRSVAFHESGHALVAALCEHADPVAKVTILPAGMALGVTEQLPEAERHLYTEAYLLDSLAVRLGGRAAELVVFGYGSTGAASDLAGATELATRMVREFGLSPALGPVGYGSRQQRFLGGEELVSRPYSEGTQKIVDDEVARILREAETRAVGLLRAHREALDSLAALLLEKETVDGAAVAEVLRLTATVPAQPGPVPASDTGPGGAGGPTPATAGLPAGHPASPTTT
ncbi:ATP-dependent zinc metalloprotease FtsH [Frankia nepalensis]|uniref:ATP-dependent zinc metalloprotease FtsH n=1 Tax=Frankia nepalensis TaxID=1836974 RepID=A0A937UR29_9ACTN|nr:ATP-dependent zinc metalloprotease FtsH [Frankia nepalensis]MBL7498530.1 ATP-dependent zinc metalloprotease FtsH [Frankia nepalensis]MBL7514309.1 ATP-dependent zinc metalloprotease FtsH [Frankia nepalensis]MBL7630887.1 ATP-dependent zinc metalloprotease FtsH [Frankia nepalensis]